MIRLDRESLAAYVAQSRLAPSVHNIQPSRWHIAGDRLELLGDRTRTIPVADPEGRDWRISHGAQFEGLAIALAYDALELRLETLHPADLQADGQMQPIGTCSIAGSDKISTNHEPVGTRMTWRGMFTASSMEDVQALNRLGNERDDCLVISERGKLPDIASLADRAGLHFLRDSAHRRELVDWMRLDKAHPRYDVDGLNAEALNVGRLEARAAGLVLGSLFPLLDLIGLSGPLISEADKIKCAAGLVLFHRPVGEDPFHSGRAFYRTWLAIERCGLKACPISVLADWPVSRETLTAKYGLAGDRELVSVFRVGRPAEVVTPIHARLPVNDLIV